MSALPMQTPASADEQAPEIEFARSAEGFPVARLGDTVFAMLSARDGGELLASAWRVRRPLGEPRRGDFHCSEGCLADEAAFRACMFEKAEHRRELRALGRVRTRVTCSTAWGSSQDATIYAGGIVSHSTASHGGFQLSPQRNGRVPVSLRCDDGWYEEDCDWAAVAIAFPHLFSAYERRCVERTVKDWRPGAFEAIFGRALAPGESFVKDRAAFERRHAGDWIVISALQSDHHVGMTEVIATLGGRRDHAVEERRSLVPSDEYGSGYAPFGFVVDEARRAACDGPSSFVTWNGSASR